MRVLFASVLLLTLVPGVATAQSAPSSVLDEAAMLRDVRVLSADSMAGRATGTPGAALARDYLLERFEAVGLNPFGDTFADTFEVQDQEGVNLIGYVEGTTVPDSFIVVTAHYDHLGVRNSQIYNGADDNASGTAALLALAERLVAVPPRHSFIFVAFDAEEMGLRGARAFVQEPPVERSAIRLNVNLDMVAQSEKDELYIAGTAHYPFLRPLLEPIVETAPVTLLFGHDTGDSPDNWTMSSDHGPFHEVGIPFVYFGVEDHSNYHKPTDDYETLTLDFYTRAVHTIYTALRALDE